MTNKKILTSPCSERYPTGNVYIMVVTPSVVFQFTIWGTSSGQCLVSVVKKLLAKEAGHN